MPLPFSTSDSLQMMLVSPIFIIIVIICHTDQTKSEKLLGLLCFMTIQIIPK